VKLPNRYQIDTKSLQNTGAIFFMPKFAIEKLISVFKSKTTEKVKLKKL